MDYGLLFQILSYSFDIITVFHFYSAVNVRLARTIRKRGAVKFRRYFCKMIATFQRNTNSREILFAIINFRNNFHSLFVFLFHRTFAVHTFWLHSKKKTIHNRVCSVQKERERERERKKERERERKKERERERKKERERERRTDRQIEREGGSVCVRERERERERKRAKHRTSDPNNRFSKSRKASITKDRTKGERGMWRMGGRWRAVEGARHRIRETKSNSDRSKRRGN